MADQAENDLVSAIAAKFAALSRATPLWVKSPGRINLIGEHTDYNDGFVMPGAIDLATWLAVGASKDNTCWIYSLLYEQQYLIDLNDIQRTTSPAWANYFLGVLQELKNRGLVLQPFHCVFAGNIPLGAGLSSSASIECGFAFALNELHQWSLSKLDLIHIGLWAEHHYVGVKCGIMDQFASVMGKAENVLVLDCRDLSYRHVPLQMRDHTLLLCDSRVKHSLVDSGYNDRHASCEQGVALLRGVDPSIRSLRDVSEDFLVQHQELLPPTVFKRCQYVVQEIRRVVEAIDDLERNDFAAFGEKMFQTHHGLSTQYEVSCPELDFLVSKAAAFPGVLGARMMGGGFGGSSINIIYKDNVKDFIEHVSREYQARFDIEMKTYAVQLKEGTNLISHSRENATLP